MAAHFTAGSFTKNFSWNKSFKRLHVAIAKGFSAGLNPASRESWRQRSEIQDTNRELIPMNYFLYSIAGVDDDFILVDQLVDAAADPYNNDFAQLALFAFHLANSGNWRHSKWPDGKVAGWANTFIIEVAGSGDDWQPSAFLDSNLRKFINDNIEGEEVTKNKVFTNYRYMLRSAGVLCDEKLQPRDLRQRWFIDAVQLFWDRHLFDGKLTTSTLRPAMEDALIENNIHRLLRCSEDQCQAFARAAYGEFSLGQAEDRIAQIQSLRAAGLIAA